ncbi:MAG TPA: hypothetical protein VNL14_16405 [Candidatus Acidoferrales bacterium]|nr:hypothetical protein [Candidatus Acidoferrales bacterium]
MSEHKDPQTREEWQEALDMASVLMLIDARKYGLITGGPEVNVERCADVLRRGAARGYKPSADAVERLLPVWM